MMQFPQIRLLGHELSGTSPQSLIRGWQGFQRGTEDEANHQRNLDIWH
jgi:hypothetical protein